VVGFDGSNRVERAITTKGEVPGDLVILAPGVAPNVTLAEGCGLTIGKTGAIAVNDHMMTSDPDIFACGDCCEATHLITGHPVYHPLGSTANKQGRVAGINAAGGDATFGGIIGTTIIKVFDFNVGMAGLLETEARESSLSIETALVASLDHAHFYPGAEPITIKLIAEKSGGRILGIQAVGRGVIDKRIDTAIAAMTFGATADQISQLDLAYAPPYSTAMDSLIVAADVLKNKLAGIARGISALDVLGKLERGEDLLLLDVRNSNEYCDLQIEGARKIPLALLRDQLSTLARDQEIVAFCKLSLRGYEAQKILEAAGFSNVKFLEGGIISWPLELKSSPSS
jgi:rhodanese-related sulfurtransferase